MQATVIYRFHADTNYALFVENLAYSVPSNLFKADAVKSQVEFLCEVPHAVESNARSLGATIETRG